MTTNYHDGILKKEEDDTSHSFRCIFKRPTSFNAVAIPILNKLDQLLLKQIYAR